MKISTAIQHKNLYQENQEPFFDLDIFLIMYVMLNRHTALAEQESPRSRDTCFVYSGD